MKKINEALIERNLKSPYLNFAYNTYTQFGDNGIINKLLNELKITSGVLVDIGAWDGIYLSNVFDLWNNKNYNAILVEADPRKANNLLQLSNKTSKIEAYNTLVSSDRNSPNCIEQIINRSQFDVSGDNLIIINIDIDGDDYGVFNSVVDYKPIIFIVETAGGWDWDTEYIGQGASLKSLTNLANDKGYTLVCCNGNAYFVRNDKISMLENFDSNLTIEDYHMKDDFVNGILTNLNPEGEVLDYMYWQDQSYLNFIDSERLKVS